MYALSEILSAIFLVLNQGAAIDDPAPKGPPQPRAEAPSRDQAAGQTLAPGCELRRNSATGATEIWLVAGDAALRGDYLVTAVDDHNNWFREAGALDLRPHGERRAVGVQSNAALRSATLQFDRREVACEKL